MSFEGGVAKMKSGMFRGRKMLSYTVVRKQTVLLSLESCDQSPDLSCDLKPQNLSRDLAHDLDHLTHHMISQLSCLR